MRRTGDRYYGNEVTSKHGNGKIVITGYLPVQGQQFCQIVRSKNLLEEPGIVYGEKVFKVNIDETISTNKT